MTTPPPSRISVKIIWDTLRKAVFLKKTLFLLCMKGADVPERAVIRNKSIIYTVSVLTTSMAASIIFFRGSTRRVFPVEILLSSDVAPVYCVLCLVHLLFVPLRFVGGFVAC